MKDFVVPTQFDSCVSFAVAKLATKLLGFFTAFALARVLGLNEVDGDFYSG
jgi:hypothetical protein